MGFQSHYINGNQFELTEKAIAEVVLFAVKNFPASADLATKLKNVILLAETVKEQDELRDAVNLSEELG